VSAYFAERGWGSITFDFAPAIDGVIVAELDRSALAESAPRFRGNAATAASTADLACHLLAGIVSSLAGRRLAAREVACACSGAPRCSIAVVSNERRASVDRALADGVRGVEPVRAALRRSTRARPVS
jgi:hypothetical protein